MSVWPAHDNNEKEVKETLRFVSLPVLGVWFSYVAPCSLCSASVEGAEIFELEKRQKAHDMIVCEINS